jgi:hypothetical protein
MALWQLRPKKILFKKAAACVAVATDGRPPRLPRRKGQGLREKKKKKKKN